LSLSHKKSAKADQRINRQDLEKEFNFEKLIGSDPYFLAVIGTASRVSSTDASILITGESGTGKELVAEAVHENSLRRNNPFIKVNMGGISAALFESEMFGHKKGAFTDARYDRTGRFETAHTGTIFLDEIGDLDLNSQVKLLRILQERKFEVLGSNETKTVDFRLICATNRDLESLAAQNKFREDLFYRINLITLKLPALRERPDDIPLLINHFVQNMKTIYGRDSLSVSKEALNWLKNQTWPGNIRELKNVVERTVLVSNKNILDTSDFSEQLLRAPVPSEKKKLPAVGSMTLEEIEKSMIQKAFEFHNANISKIARSLGLSRPALYRRMEKYGISE